jgi:hypothetical protein
MKVNEEPAEDAECVAEFDKRGGASLLAPFGKE